MSSKKAARQLTESEFQKVFVAVRSDISTVQFHSTVFDGVMESLRKYPSVENNFRAFFAAFVGAMRTDLVIRLGRIYDPEGTGHDSCTLHRCLATLRSSPHFFTDEAITARLSESYRKWNRDCLLRHRVDVVKLDEDINAIVKSRTKLIKLRHKVYAHKDLEMLLARNYSDLLSSHEEIKVLIELAHRIWNQYSQIWDASTHSAKTIGEDDYKWLFQSVRRGMKAKRVFDNRRTAKWVRRVEELKNKPKQDDPKNGHLRK